MSSPADPSRIRQLGLPFDLAPPPSLDGFVAGPNAEALAAVRALAGGGAARPLYLWGTADSGKTHLLRALAATAGGCHVAAADVADATLPLGQALIAVDALESIAGSARAERALFSLVNAQLDAGMGLALAARTPPGALPIALPDLASRLQAALVLRLMPLDEDERVAAMQAHARARGLDLADDVPQYLLRRLPRDLGTLLGALDALDRASLAGQRRLTVPFVREWLAAAGIGSGPVPGRG